MPIDRQPTTNLVLASGSPRRAKILREAGLAFTVAKTDAPEVSIPHAPAETVRRNARAKHDAALARWVADHPGEPTPRFLAADTIVWFANRIYGKPRDLDEAKEFLRELSGRTHVVFTGVVCGEREAVAESRVTFQRLDEATIDAYVRRVNPVDRAGAYDIDESGDLIVAGFEGEYENVMGLPLAPLRMWGLLD